MSEPSSRIPSLKGDGMRLRMYARVDQLSTEKERRTGVHMYGNIRGQLEPIFQRVRDAEQPR